MNGSLGFAVEGGGRLVQYQYRSVLQQDAPDGDTLALAARELDATVADECVIALAAFAVR